MKQWRFALRSLIRRPGFSLTAVGLLTLGIGANTALFSVVNTVLLKPLPYPDASRLVAIYEANQAKSQSESLIAPGRLEEWNRLSRTFTAIAGLYSENVTDTSGSEPQRLAGVRVSPRFFAVYGAAPLVGRTFTAEEELAGGPLAAVISYGLWTRRYGQDPGVTSRRLVIGGQGYSIIGVMPKTEGAPARNFTKSGTDVWIPARTPQFLMQIRDARFFSGVGRMKPGVTIEGAQADLARVQRVLGEQFPATDKGWSASVRSLRDARVGDSARQLLLLFGAVALLMLITVTNVAGLVVAQLSRRARELAVRTSIGATRGQVVGSVMREMVALSLAGALGGWALAAASMTLLVKLLAAVPRIPELELDWRALAFAALVSLAGAAAFGLLPALRATSARYAGNLFRAGRGIAGQRQWGQRALVTGQIALTMTLLAGAGLMLRSFQNLTHVDLGFNAGHTLLFHVGAAWDEDRVRIGHLQERLLSGLQKLPGVQAAGVTNFLPASGASLRYQVSLEGAAGTQDTGKMPAGMRTVSPGYLKAIQAPLLAGTWCPELRTDFDAPPKTMVNRRFVEVYARGGNVVGRHIRTLDFPSSNPVEVVGVIGDIKEDALNLPAYPYAYTCAVGGGWPDPEYVVRAAGDPRALLGSIRQLVHEAAPQRAIFGVHTLEEDLDEVLDRPRTNAAMLALFALTAMALAAVGLYGLMAQIVSARRQELGIRMALGARPAQCVRAVMAGAGRLVAIGMAAGFVLMLAGDRLLHSVLFGVSPLDAVSIGAAALLLTAVSALAAFLPARHAAAIDPMEAMRVE